MKQRLKIQIDAPHIEEYHDVLHYVTQRIDTGFTGGSGGNSSSGFYDHSPASGSNGTAGKIIMYKYT